MPETPPRPIDERLPAIRHALRGVDHLLVCLDFDGTLAPIVEDPDEATIAPTNDAMLEGVAAEESITTAIVSGRTLADVRERVDAPGIYAGNHGLEIAQGGSVTVHPAASERAALIEEVCAFLETALEAIPGTRVENKRLTGSVHVRAVPEPAHPLVRRFVEDAVSRIGEGGLEVSTGKAVLEVTPSVPWGKGQAISLLEERLSTEPFVIYVGDDRTDESAFRAVEPDGVGILVGDRQPSAASARVRSPAVVTSLLHWLSTVGVELLEEDRAEGWPPVSSGRPRRVPKGE